MAELVRTNDPALLSAIEGLLTAGRFPTTSLIVTRAPSTGLSKSSSRGFWFRMTGKRKHAPY